MLLQAQVHAAERQIRSLQDERQSIISNNNQPAPVQQINHALKVAPARRTTVVTTTTTIKPAVQTMVTHTANKTVSKPATVVNNTAATADVPVRVPLSKPTYTAAVTPSVDHLDLKRVGKHTDSRDSSSSSSSDSHSDKAVISTSSNDFHHDRVKHTVPQTPTAVAKQQHHTTAAAAHTTPQRSAASWVKKLWNRGKTNSSDQQHGDSKTAASTTSMSSSSSESSDHSDADLEFFGVGG
jgi:hypothetical protein